MRTRGFKGSSLVLLLAGFLTGENDHYSSQSGYSGSGSVELRGMSRATPFGKESGHVETEGETRDPPLGPSSPPACIHRKRAGRSSFGSGLILSPATQNAHLFARYYTVHISYTEYFARPVPSAWKSPKLVAPPRASRSTIVELFWTRVLGYDTFRSDTGQPQGLGRWCLYTTRPLRSSPTTLRSSPKSVPISSRRRLSTPPVS